MPIDKIHELPRILIELELELPFFINRQLRGWIECARVLVLV
jgi:hypothetical protein